VRNVTGTVAVVPEVDAAPTSIGAADWHRQIGLKPRAASERRRSCSRCVTGHPRDRRNSWLASVE
jgi:hypothetical protein